MRFIAGFEARIDQALSTMVSSTSASITQGVAGLVTAGLTIYIMFLAFAISRGEVQEPMSKLVKEVMTMAFIAAIATATGVYQEKIVGGANALLGVLTQAVTQSGAKTVGETLDLLWFEGVSTPAQGTVPMHSVLWVIAQDHTSAIGIPDVSFALAQVIVWIGMMVLCICCLLPTILAKVGMSLMLAIGPMFIYMAMIPHTRNYFASWLSNMLGNLLTLVLVALICSSTVNMFRDEMQTKLQNMSYESSQPLGLALVLLVIAAAMGIASLHVSQIGAQLAGGGLALDTKGLAGNVVQALMQRKPPEDPNKSQTTPNQMESGGSSASSRLGQVLNGNSKKG